MIPRGSSELDPDFVESYYLFIDSECICPANVRVRIINLYWLKSESCKEVSYGNELLLRSNMGPEAQSVRWRF